jgi:predicted metalloprotease with PDZ domain
VYDENRSDMVRGREEEYHAIDASYSIGLQIKEDGEVTDTVEGMLAARAGIGPGMKVVAVNGRRFTQQVLRDALASGKNSKEPLQLLVENTDYFRTFNLDYHEGEKYPHLVRDDSKPDLLTDIVRAH